MNPYLRKLPIILGVIAILLALAVIFVPGKEEVAETPDASADQSVAEFGEEFIFACADGRDITARFSSDGLAEVGLSDGRSYTLEQVISASGARYANEGETFVFWNKGNGAFIQENGETTYDNCFTENSN